MKTVLYKRGQRTEKTMTAGELARLFATYPPATAVMAAWEDTIAPIAPIDIEESGVLFDESVIFIEVG
jgi:hypothetical protein